MGCAKNAFLKSVQAGLVVQPLRENISLAPTGKAVVPLRASCAYSRGALRDRHERLVRDATNVGGVARRAASHAV